MLFRIRTAIRRKRARSYVENTWAWYTICQNITWLIGDALHDPSVAENDVGYVIDQVDRMLLDLGFYITDSMGTLRHR